MSVPSSGRKLYSLLMFVVVSMLGGVLAAGIVVPTAGFSAELARSSATLARQLPQDLETPPQYEGSKVLMKDGTVLTNFFDENRVYVTLDQIAPVMQQAQIAIEDQRFYEHGAMDLRGTLRAAVRTLGGSKQGASTLTQQYVKLVLLNEAMESNDPEQMKAARERDFGDKLRELRYALALEEKLSKDEILERYLNMSYYGAGAYGVEAAARTYFNTSAKKLTLPQAAMIAGLVRNPVTTDPIRYEKIAIDRRNQVLDRMADPDVAMITREEADKAKKEKFDKKKVRKALHGCANSKYPHLCQMVERTMLRLDSMGPDKESRRDLLNRGGLTIQTNLDPRFQDAAQKAVSDVVAPTDPVIATMVVIQPGTGLIMAAAQSRPKMGNNAKAGESYYGYWADPEDGGAEGYQGGSTFKAFTLAAAVEAGIPTSVTIDAPASKDYQGETFRSCTGPIKVRKSWQPRGAAGVMDMYSGTRRSSNNFFVMLQQMAGLCNTTKMADKLGLKTTDPVNRPLVGFYDQIPSFTLGAAEVTPLSLANAYATLAARGKRCDPIIIESATRKDGQKIEVPSANCQQVIDKDVADTVNNVLKAPFRGGTASPAYIPGYDLAGKTGTESKAPSVLLMGYTPSVVGAATITVDKAHPRFKGLRPERRTLVGVRLASGRVLYGRSGYEAGALIWKPAMQKILPLVPKKSFPGAPSSTRVGAITSIPDCSGETVSHCQSMLVNAGFSTRIVREPHKAAKGTLLGTSPRGSASKYSLVRILVSDGMPEKKDDDDDDKKKDDKKKEDRNPYGDRKPGKPGR